MSLVVVSVSESLNFKTNIANYEGGDIESSQLEKYVSRK
jgi:hypothetical protein